MDNLSFDASGSRIADNGAIMLDGSKAAVWFKREAKHMVAASELEGREVWEERDYVYVQQPGDLSPVRREVQPGDNRRWPNQWQAYQEGRKDVPAGTPISILFPASPSMAKNLESLGIFTIEQLAEVPDSSLVRIPFGGELKEKAKKYIAALNGAEGFNKMQAQLDRERERATSLEMQIAEMQRTMATLQAQRESDPGNNASVSPLQLGPEQIAQIMAAMKAAEPPKRGPGRPPRTPMET